MLPNNIWPLHEQLAFLASQHHTSEYNRSKFGINGSPHPYLPLSLHLPEHFTQLRSRQLSDAQALSWWPAHGVPDTRPVCLQDEIMAAMSEPIYTASIKSSQFTTPPVKTSLTHPINISFVIPLQFIDLISSHALLASPSHSPTILDITSSFTLDRLSTVCNTQLRNFLPAPPPPPLFPIIETPVIPGHFRTRSTISDDLEVAINTGNYVGSNKNGSSAEHITSHFLSGFIPQTNISMSLSISSVPASANLRHSLGSQVPPGLSDSFETVAPLKLNTASRTLPPLPPRLPQYEQIPNLTLPKISIPYQLPRHNRALPIGNLLLSSCPGKKVRLSGPVKGRGGVCRDLETDIRRMKQLGVGCIICCLDDKELEYLGAPWAEYEKYAQTIGIDVLRMPIPEGLPPISAEFIDTHLVDLIKRYTLKGVPILVHCRGGVGRAGVIACCWMIRMGLFGWPIQNDGETSSPSSSMPRNKSAVYGSVQSVSFIERVIGLIRRRRSTKAIETYEQVKFLLDYVDYLQYHSKLRQDQIDML